MTKLTALLVTWHARRPYMYGDRLTRELGRPPDAEDLVEAHRVLDAARHAR